MATTTARLDTSSAYATPSRSSLDGHTHAPSSSKSMRYLRGRVSSSLQSPSASVGVATESYLRLKKKGSLSTWTTRFLVLRGAQLVWFHNKQDAQWRRGVQEITYVDYGRLTTLRSHELGLEIKLTDGKEFVARTFDRADLAKWITAFQRLAFKKENARNAATRLSETLTADSTATGDYTELELEQKRKSRMEPERIDKSIPSSRHVTFHKSVLVRTIPTVSDEEIAELYYSRKDLEKFSARASSFLCRTEEVVSCAYRAIRRPHSFSCRHAVA